VSKRFLSNAQHAVDKQGRASLPALFRTVAGELDPAVTAARKRGERPPPPRIYLMPGYLGEKCIVGQSEQGMRSFTQRVAGLADQSTKSRIEYGVLAHAAPTPIDEVGRIVIPRDLRDRYKITDKAHFVGKAEYFEIWNADAFAAKMAREQAAWDEGGGAAVAAQLGGALLPPESPEAEE
jgi:MraZ protein